MGYYELSIRIFFEDYKGIFLLIFRPLYYRRGRHLITQERAGALKHSSGAPRLMGSVVVAFGFRV